MGVVIVLSGLPKAAMAREAPSKEPSDARSTFFLLMPRPHVRRPASRSPSPPSRRALSDSPTTSSSGSGHGPASMEAVVEAAMASVESDGSNTASPGTGPPRFRPAAMGLAKTPPGPSTANAPLPGIGP